MSDQRQNRRPSLLGRSQIDFVSKEKLKEWVSILKYLDAKEEKDQAELDLEGVLRDLVHRLEDILLEMFYDKDQPRRCVGRNTSSRRAKVLKISEQVNNKQREGYNRNTNAAEQNIDQLRRQDIVGMAEEFTSVGNIMLSKATTSLKAICIYGRNGIGKTSLAWKLFSNNFVPGHFDCYAWVQVGEDFKPSKVLRYMLKQLSPSDDDPKETCDSKSLRDSLCKSLNGRRYLVVLDDLRSPEHWDYLRTIFPNDQNRSTLLVTTRSRVVAIDVAGDARSGFIFTKSELKKSDASVLFWKKARPGNSEVEQQIKKYGEDILKVCNGFPSAIVAVGRLLAENDTYDDWKQVLDNTKLLLSKGLVDQTKLLLSRGLVDRIRFVQAISASRFDDLPYHLKPCFLYLGMFPKGSKIGVEHLYLLWMGEGIISPDNCQADETMMDLAERCLSELVQREFVEVEEEEIPSLTKYKFCWVHEDMQDHCLEKGKEYFFKVLDFGQRTHQTGADSSSLSQITNLPRRMALHFREQYSCSVVHQFKNEEYSHLRALLFLNLHHNSPTEWKLPKGISDVKKFKVIRVLTFKHINLQGTRIPTGLTRLIYLRYLSLEGCTLKALPASIGNLSFLEILDLRVLETILIPDVLWKMKRLRYLYLPLKFQTPTDGKLSLGSLKDLEILVNFDTRVCNAADLLEMVKLRYLSITVEGILGYHEGIVGDLDQIVCHLETSARASALCLSMKVEKFDSYTEERHSVFRRLLECKVLHTLYINGHLGHLPKQSEITSSLTEIVLIGSQIKRDPMETLHKLPNLRVLVLKDNAFIGKQLNFLASGFLELKRLELFTLHLLEKLEVENKAMPKLSKLTIKSCRGLKLETTPEALMHRDPLVTFENDDLYYCI